MPASSEKQRKFFGVVRAIQLGKMKGSPEARKVASSISAKDASDFASSIAELKIKKAVLEILKNTREPMYLEEQETNPVGKTFVIKGDFEKYIKQYIGQPFSEKELEAVNNFQETKPTKIERLEIRYETTDDFQNSTTTVLKKMKEAAQFSYIAFSKHTRVESPEPETPESPEAQDSMEPPALEEWLNELDATPMEEPKEDITVTKSSLFTDEISGAAILSEFLKKLDL